MFKVEEYHDQLHIPGSMRKYCCSSIDDLDKLPRFGIPGTQDTGDIRQDYFENAPCSYGSIAIISDSGVTSAYKLFPNNEWTKM